MMGNKIAKNITAYRADIDGLRALAVLAVVAYHAFPNIVKGGFVGVDIFFVISGFLISGIILDGLAQNKFSLFTFYARRIRRIFPALFLVLASVLILGWFVLFPHEYEALGKHVFGGAGFISNILFWREAGYWDVSAQVKPLLHLWSLGIEEQFYIIFPFLLIFIWKKKLRIFTMILLLLALSFFCNVYYCKRNPVMDFYAPYTRFWELLAGVVMAVLARWKNQFFVDIKRKLNSFVNVILYEPSKSNTDNVETSLADLLFSWLGILLLLIAFIGTTSNHFPGYWALLPVLGTMLILAAGPQAWINRTLLSNKLAIGIGLISYPLYLWHWPLLSYAYILQGAQTGTWSWRFIRLGCVMIAVILAFLTYKFVELPIRFGPRAKKNKVYVLIFLIAVVGSIGLYVKLQDGLPERNTIKAYEKIFNGMQPVLPGKIDSSYTDAHSTDTVAVIGDSHSRCAYLGIAEKNYSLGMNTLHLSYDPQRSDSENKLNMQTLISRNDIKNVFIILRGVVWLTGYDFDWPKKNPHAPLDNFQPLLQKTIDELRAAGKKIFILSENPVLPYEPKNYINSRPLCLTKPDIMPPVVTKKDVLAHQKDYLAMLGRLKGAIIIKSIDAFCPREECLTFSHDGIPLYSDDDHLSITGSRFQVEHLLEPYLVRIAEEAKHAPK